MEKIRLGSLNINGGRNRQRRAVVGEIIKRKLTSPFYKKHTVTQKMKWNGKCGGKGVYYKVSFGSKRTCQLV